jgi:hypothetical protein
MDVIDKWYKGYGDIPPFGNGPDQSQLHEEGNAYIRSQFPKTEFIQTCNRLAVSISEEKNEEIHEEHAEEKGKDDDDGGKAANEQVLLIQEEEPEIISEEGKQQASADAANIDKSNNNNNNNNNRAGLRKHSVHAVQHEIDSAAAHEKKMLFRLCIAFLLLSVLVFIFIKSGNFKLGGSKSQ